MKLLRILVFLLCCSLSIWAQTDKITDGILEQSALLIHSDIARGEKQALFFTQNQSNKGNTIKAFLIQADAAYLKGDYAAANRDNNRDNRYPANNSYSNQDKQNNPPQTPAN